MIYCLLQFISNLLCLDSDFVVLFEIYVEFTAVLLPKMPAILSKFARSHLLNAWKNAHVLLAYDVRRREFNLEFFLDGL